MRYQRFLCLCIDSTYSSVKDGGAIFVLTDYPLGMNRCSFFSFRDRDTEFKPQLWGGKQRETGESILVVPYHQF